MAEDDRIPKESLDKIFALFDRMQVIDGRRPIQLYIEREGDRILTPFAADYRSDLSAKWIYVNVPTEKLRKWHWKIWNQGIKKIPHTAGFKEYPEIGITRFGFY